MYQILLRSFNAIDNMKLVHPEYSYLPFMGHPIQLLGLTLAYLYFVLYKGKEMMKNRKPYDLKNIILVYNAIQVVANFSLAVVMIYTIWKYKMDPLCLSLQVDDSPRAKDEFIVSYCFFLLKFIDLLDTVFFVLRKKFNQITFLHVYHHAMMFFLIGFIMRIYPGGHSGWMAIPNCFVHTAMYTYYYLTAKKKSLIKWKKHITQFQIFQFLLISVCMLIPLVRGNCNYPNFVLYCILSQNIIMLYMFGNFYYKTYVKNNEEKML